MRFPTLTKLVAAVSLVAAVVPAAGAITPTSAAVVESAPRTARLPDDGLADNRAAAEASLAAVEAAFDRKAPSTRRDGAPTVHEPVELTMLMVALRRGLDDLSPADQQLARAYLARPTDAVGEYYGASYGVDSRPTNSCNERFCVHWAQATRDAPPTADHNQDGQPDQVEVTRKILNEVWDRIVTQGGYDAPRHDTRGADAPSAEKFDVYLVDIGDSYVYGFCVPEHVAGSVASSYCVLDEDFAQSQFPTNTPLENLQVTAAHEFFHAVQFAYDYLEDIWFMEGSAAWVEDEVYDAVDDNRAYLSYSPLRLPRQPLDTSDHLHVYGNWIWWRFLTDPGRYDDEGGTGLPLLMRELWDRARTTYSVKAVSQELVDRGDELGDVFARFSAANRRPGDFYEEGAHYRPSGLADTFTLTAERRKVAATTTRLDHLSSATVSFRPGSGLAGVWKLRLVVDAPSSLHSPSAEATVFLSGGGVRKAVMRLDTEGVGRKNVRFDSGNVRRVELTLSNGGHRYACGRGSYWACEGQPRSENRPFTFAAKAVR